MYVWEDQAHNVCVCRKPWQGELTVKCSGCNVYFHPNCLYIQGVSKVFDQLWHDMAFLIFGAQT